MKNYNGNYDQEIEKKSPSFVDENDVIDAQNETGLSVDALLDAQFDEYYYGI